MLSNLNSKFIKDRHFEKLESIINDVDIYTDSLKTDLDTIRDIWLANIKDFKRVSNIDKKKERLIKNHESIQTDDYSESLEQLQKKFKGYEKYLPIIEFRPLLKDLRMEKIGCLKIKELISDGNRALRNDQKLEVWNYRDKKQVFSYFFKLLTA